MGLSLKGLLLDAALDLGVLDATVVDVAALMFININHHKPFIRGTT